MDPAPSIMTFAGPWGPYHVAGTEDGIMAAEWSMSREAFEALVVRRLHGRPVDPAAARARLAAARPVLEAVVAGRHVDATVVPLDLADRPAFDRRVLMAVREVAWGRTASYGEIARRVGSPRAARAVGGAVGRNPIALLVPCHRIIAADGTLGGYGGDGPVDRAASLERKRELLLREGITVESRAG